jgi:hypothetical protein
VAPDFGLANFCGPIFQWARICSSSERDSLDLASSGDCGRASLGSESKGSRRNYAVCRGLGSGLIGGVRLDGFGDRFFFEQAVELGLRQPDQFLRVRLH